MFPLHTLEVLEFFSLLELVAREAASEPGREKVMALRPQDRLEDIQKNLLEVAEAMNLEREGDFPSLAELEEIRPLLEKARPRGAMLVSEELLKIKKQLSLASRMRKTLGQRDQLPLLASQIQKLHLLEDLWETLSRVISPYGEILDSASPQLTQIRLKKEGLRREIRERLQQLLTSPHLSQALQERTITMRNGRYVVPIKAQFSGKVKGLVQDQSATGATLYIEPFSVVELNNHLVRTEKEEEQEIERILKECTALVREHSGALVRNQAILAHLDSLGARARFALKYRGSVPSVSREPTWTILEGRHPLLIKEKGLEGTVPLEITLSKGTREKGAAACHSLVITGPNTGGKTVALKTMGLLAIMVQSGIPPTAHPDSSFPVFKKILADIGDEQSIQQNLSTFSSHMRNIKQILDHADSETLAVIDELGAGTDPWEGTPLAISILEELHKRGTWCLISTHHNELKLFAHAMPGMKNASVEFDPQTLSPTYRLLVGVPGKSNAFIIAERLGIPSKLIERAKGLQDEGRGRIEEAITQLEAEAQKARKVREALERREKEKAAEARRIREAKEALLSEQEKCLGEARRLLSFVHREVKRLSKGLKQQKPAEVQRHLREIEERMALLDSPKGDEVIGVGDRVRVWGLGLEGVILSLAENKAEVDTGKMRVVVPVDRLSLIEKGNGAPPELQPPSLTFSYRGSGMASMDLNLVGKRVDEAIPLMEKFIDGAYLAGLKEVRIIHGVGTGILKRAVREHLDTSPLVESFQEAPKKEGGAGATIVKLKES